MRFVALTLLARPNKLANICQPRGALAAFALVLLFPGQAAADTTLALDLNKSLDLARKHSLRLQDRTEEIEAAAFRRKQARGRFFPRVSFSARYSRVSHVEPGSITLPGLPGSQPLPPVQLGQAVDDQASVRLQLDQPLFSGLALLRGYSASGHALDVARERQRTEEQDLRVQVEESYFGLKKAFELREVTRKSESLLEAQLARVRNLERAGKATSLDVARVLTRLSSAKVSLVQVDGAVSTAHLALTTLLGLPSTTRLELAEPLEKSGLGRPAARDLLLREALSSRSELALARSAAALSADRARAEAAGLWPQIWLRFGYSYDRPNQRYFPPKTQFDPSWDLTVGLSWTLWDFGTTYYGMRAAEREASIARRAVAATAEAVTLDVERRRQGAIREVERIAAAREAVAVAERAFRTTVEIFEAGQATNLEVLDAELELTRARSDLAQALADARIAAAQLNRAVGKSRGGRS